MSRLSAFGKGRAFGLLSVAGLVGMVAFVAGCGGSKITTGPVFLEMVEYDHYFFDDPAPTERASRAHAKVIKAEVERLATQSWRIARANLIKAGKDAIPTLIENIERPELTHVALRPVPGPTAPESRGSWTLGQVVHSVLRDLAGNYGNFEGSRLPAADKAAWGAWWRANKRKVAIYTTEGTIPAHVRKQKKAAVAAMVERYPSLDGTVNKMLEKRAAKEREKEAALQAREAELLEKKRKIEAK
jgi:hypothetical protein